MRNTIGLFYEFLFCVLLPVINSGEATKDCHNTPELNSDQCIFYPVKEEEREFLVGAAPTNSENLSIGSSSNVQHPEHQTKDSNLSESFCFKAMFFFRI